jgi:alkanesulfonate monooxygenase SsuD/methylene tetrahydromethanopterin reductase-like flavin-dependent oxidoreductase (luciferase family)
VAPTDAEAREVARRGAQWTVTAYANPARRAMVRRPRPGSDEVDAGRWAEDIDPVERYVNEVIIHGSPTRVVDELLRLREEIGLDYLLCAPLSHQTFLLLTDEVLPALARVERTAAAAP